MTSGNSLKRLIRARMAQTGESFSTARSVLLRSATQENNDKRALSLKVVLAQPQSRSGDLATDLANLFADASVPDCDLIVLPELIGGNAKPAQYKEAVRRLASDNDCYVVGGSCYASTSNGRINSGIVVDRNGDLVCGYEKIRPYGSENQSGVLGGSNIGQFEIEGRSIAVLICSDLWFSETFATFENEPDLLLIPSFSITQRGDPKKARDLWKHMIISRAYEYSAYVGVCDWAHPCEFDGLLAAGVSGFANPRPSGDEFFASNLDLKIQSYDLDFDRLDSFRANKVDRGFTSRPTE